MLDREAVDKAQGFESPKLHHQIHAQIPLETLLREGSSLSRSGTGAARVPARGENMGLDITAYSKLDYIGHHPGPQPDGREGNNCQYDEATWDRRHIQAFAYSDFPHALQGIPGRPEIRNEAYGSTSFLSAGCFAVTAGTETHSFRAGSYSGYSRWREHLSRCFARSRDTEDPFFELIHFADNEGTLLWLPAKNLAADFEAGREQWRDYLVDNFADDPYQPKYWLEKYEDWSHACKLAANGGLVDFH